MATAGASNLLSGIAGTVPNTLLTTSVAITELTGAAAWRIGVAAGVVLVGMALLPKAVAAVLAFPAVVAAYLLVLMATMLLVGVRMIVQGGLNQRNGLIVGVAFWLGAGFQYGLIFPAFADGFAGHHMCSSAQLREALQGAGGDDAAIAHLASALELTDSPTLAIWKFCDGLDKVVGDGDCRATPSRTSWKVSARRSP